MGRNPMPAFFQRINEIYKPWKVPHVIALAIDVFGILIGLFFPSFFETLPLQLKVTVLSVTLLLFILPLIIFLVNCIIKFISQIKEFPSLVESKNTLEQLNKDLRDKLSITEKKYDCCRKFASQFMTEEFSENLYEVTGFYTCDNDVYIVVQFITENYCPDLVVDLIDTSGWYIFGRFNSGVIKQDGVHMRNVGELDALFLTYVRAQPSGKLRPSVYAIRVEKETG